MAIGTGHDIIAGIDAQVAGTGPAVYGTQKPYVPDATTGQLVVNPNYGGAYSSAELDPYKSFVGQAYHTFLGAGPENDDVVNYWASDLRSAQHYNKVAHGMSDTEAFNQALATMHMNFGASAEYQDIVAGGPDRGGVVKFPSGGSRSTTTTTTTTPPAPPQTQAMIYGGGGGSGTNINKANREAETAVDNFKILKDDPNKLSGSNRNLYNTNYTKSQGGTTPPGGAVRNTNIPTA